MADKYKLVKKIGKGSYGSAYLAHIRNDPLCQVVIKRVSLRGLSVKDVEDSLKEAQVLKLLDHPCIIKHIEHFKQDEDNLCIVTELAENGDLQSRVKNAKACGRLFREETIWQWFIQLCCAIKHVHDRKILHRDIKTANIFLSGGRDGEDPMVKLGDFGISKILENTADCAKTAVGTPYYMSPELCESKPYNYKSDIWAIGCVLYEIATLKQPFDAANFNSLCIKILRGKYSPLPDAYSPELKQIVGLLLERDPEKRPDVNFLLAIRPIRVRLSSFSKLHPLVLQNEFSHTALHGFNAKQVVGQCLSKPSSSQADSKSTKVPALQSAKVVLPCTNVPAPTVIDRGISPPAAPRSPPGGIVQQSSSPATPRNAAISPPTTQPMQSMISPRVQPGTPRTECVPGKANVMQPMISPRVVTRDGISKPSIIYQNELQGAPGEVGAHAMNAPVYAKKDLCHVNPKSEKAMNMAIFASAPKAGGPMADCHAHPSISENLEEDKIVWNGQTLRLPGIGTRDSRPSRIESLRVFLERNIGANPFLQAYRLMESVSEDDDEQKLEVQLLDIVGQSKAEFLPLICQLIFCEDREDRANRILPPNDPQQKQWIWNQGQEA